MCMGRNLGKAALKRYQAKGKNGYIRVWKSVHKGRKCFVSDWMGHRYKDGFTHARRDTFSEHDLIHAFRNKACAKRWASFSDTVVECLIRPRWITAIGKNDHRNLLTLTTKAIVMPEFPKTKVTVREFRAAVKGKKVKTYKWE